MESMDYWFKCPGQSANNEWIWNNLHIHGVSSFSQVILMDPGFCLSLWLAKKVKRRWKRKNCELVWTDPWSLCFWAVFNQIPFGLVLPPRKRPVYLCHNSHHLLVLYSVHHHDVYHGLPEDIPTGWVINMNGWPLVILSFSSTVEHKLCIKHYVRHFKGSPAYPESEDSGDRHAIRVQHMKVNSQIFLLNLAQHLHSGFLMRRRRSHNYLPQVIYSLINGIKVESWSLSITIHSYKGYEVKAWRR